MPDAPLDDRARAALAFLPHAKDLMRLVSAQLPPSTDFGIVILVPAAPGRVEVVALTTDRVRVARAAGEWVVDVLNPEGV